jgi:hypothetical protein
MSYSACILMVRDKILLGGDCDQVSTCKERNCKQSFGEFSHQAARIAIRTNRDSCISHDIEVASSSLSVYGSRQTLNIAPLSILSTYYTAVFWCLSLGKVEKSICRL